MPKWWRSLDLFERLAIAFIILYVGAGWVAGVTGVLAYWSDWLLGSVR